MRSVTRTERFLPHDPAQRAKQLAHIRRLYEEHEIGVVALGKRFSVDHQSIRRALTEAGVPIAKGRAA